MATELGKYLRKLRIDNDELMKTMADKMGIAPSTLSSIENGRRNPSKGFIDRVCKVYGITGSLKTDLETALEQSKKEISLQLSGLPSQDKELAVSFARKFASLDESDKDRIRKILHDDDA